MINRNIEKIIKKIVGNLYQNIEIPYFVVEYPKHEEYGDYSSSIAMVLAKELNKKPIDIAKNIISEIEKNEESKQLFDKITAVDPGFLNFEISESYLRRNTEDVLRKKEKFGASDIGKGKTVIIDYSSPNVAKPMHVGHLRSTIIGHSLCNIYKTLGYKVIGDNHIGEWGTQFGKLIYAYKHWGNKKIISKNPIKEMTKLYVKFHKEAENNKELEELARKETKRLQDKDGENIKIWKFLVRESMKDFNKIYKTLGIKFNNVLGESFYSDMLDDVVKEILLKKAAVESEGAIIINLDKYKLPPFLIKKRDGAYLYSTTDLAAMKYGKKKFNPAKKLYVVSNEQALHFEQLFSSLKLLGWCEDVDLKHIKFGMVLGDSGKKFSTRKGDTVKLMDLIKKSIDLAHKTVEKKNPDLSSKEKRKIARIVGIGSVRYNDLSQNRLTDITFDWNKMLSFDGNSAPYLQYTNARINSLIAKFNKDNMIGRINVFDKPDLALLKEASEKNIMRHLIKFPEVIEKSAKENAPHLIALYIYDLACAYNSFYNSVPILKSEKKLAKSRIALSKSVAIVLKNGLWLLGIGAPEKM